MNVILTVLAILTLLSGCIAVKFKWHWTKDFPIYWHMPADPCTQFGYDFTFVKWNFVKNSNNLFQGDRISIFYSAGSFPRIDTIPFGNTTKITNIRNNGVPQAGNLTYHLQAFREEIDRVIPNRNYNGLAIIDMEDWYPRWSLNTGYKDIYRAYSRELVSKANPTFKTWHVEEKAISSFHEYAEKFLLESVKVAKAERPNAVWGYYEFPYCDNYRLIRNQMPCSDNVKVENEKYLYLFKEVDALYPHIYLYNSFNESTRAKYIIGRLEEAYRVLHASSINRPVYPYVNPTLIESNPMVYLNKVDLLNSLLIPRACGTDGVIIWGSSSWFNTAEKCATFNEYLTTTLGPAVDYITNASTEEAKQWLRKRGLNITCS